MIQDYKFNPETETGTHKWVNFEFIKYNSNLLIWIDGKEYTLYKYNADDRSEFLIDDTLPSLKEDTLGNLKVFYKHDFNNNNYVEDFEIQELSYGPFPTEKMIENNERSRSLFDFNLSKITSTSIQVDTFSNIPQSKTKLIKKNKCPLNQQVRKRRSTTSEMSNQSQSIATNADALM